MGFRVWGLGFRDMTGMSWHAAFLEGRNEKVSERSATHTVRNALPKIEGIKDTLILYLPRKVAARRYP